MSEAEERISGIIRAYDAQGRHRTGTEVDRRSADWLAGLVRALGLEPSLEPFPLHRVNPLPSCIELDGHEITGLPLFDGTFTGEAGTQGRLGPLGSTAEIGLTALPPVEHATGPFREARRTGGHRGIVAVTRGGAPGIAALNAPDFATPFGPPVLQVGKEHEPWLEQAAAQGAGARLVVAATREQAEALNVTARIAGSEPGIPALVVMTPRSGWWQCASERGGGLACWIEAMRAVAERGTRRDVIFIASSGHELGHLGIEAFIARRPGLAEGALAWVHLGANIGAAAGGVRLAASDTELQRLALDALDREGASPAAVVAAGTAPNGEARNVHRRGGRYLSLVGSNSLFHLEADRWPGAVDAPAVTRHAAACAGLIVALAQG
jgi:hypothetical protein